MTSVWFFPAFFVFLLFGLYVWLLGGAFCRGSPGIPGLFRKPWLGYGILLGLLQITHLFWPVDYGFAARFILMTAVLAISVHLGRAILRGQSVAGWARGWPSLLPLALVGFLAFLPVFNTCTKPACHYDLGLYYLQEIRWMETFPIVRGLGHLILNLGFNQSAFLVTSLLDSLLPDRIGLWLVGGLLPWLGLTLSAYALLRLFVGRKAGRSSLELAYAISFPAWLYTLLGNNISSGSPDVTSSCLMIHLFLSFAAFIMTADHGERARLFADLCVVGAVCVCLKLNTLGLVVGVFVASVLFLVLEKDLLRIWRARAMWGAAIAAVLLGFWVYRGILLSGYPFFPSRVGAATVSWQVKAQEADQLRADMVYWARIPWGDRQVALQGFGWVGPWLKRVLASDVQFDWPIGIGLAGSGALLVLAWMEQRLRRCSYFLMLLCAPLLLHAVFWIATAPEPRYFGSAAWLFAAAPILGLLAVEHSFASLAAIANLYICAVPLAGLILETSWAWGTPNARFPEIPRSPMAEYENALGLSYYAPIEGNQTFDHELPSANRKLHDIGLINPAAGISGGFRSIGERERVGKAE